MQQKYNKLKQKQILVEHYIRSDEAKNMLNIYEAVVINILASYIGDGNANNNMCWESQKELARSCFMSLRQLKRALKSLLDKKIINIKRKQYKNYYSFNEFWLEEVSKYSSHLDAVKSFKAKSDMPNRPSDRSISPNSPIYNNKNNNQSYPQAKTWDGPAETRKSCPNGAWH